MQVYIIFTLFLPYLNFKTLFTDIFLIFTSFLVWRRDPGPDYRTNRHGLECSQRISPKLLTYFNEFWTEVSSPLQIRQRQPAKTWSFSWLLNGIKL